MTQTNPKKKFNRHARHKAREFALQALYQWDLSGNNIQDIEQQFLLFDEINTADLDFFRELLHNIPARISELQEQMLPFLDRPIKELNPIERALLSIGVYELCYRQDIPYKVIINEAIELAKIFGATEGHKYVNSILDRVARVTREKEI